MSTSGGKTVALVDPVWAGHHPMYFSQFTASFLRTGATVIGLCPQPAAAREDLRKALGAGCDQEWERRVVFHELPGGKRSFFNGRFEGDPLRTFHRWRRAAKHLAAAEALHGLRADLVYFPYLDSYLRFLPLSLVPRLVLKRRWSGLYLRNHHHGERPSPVKFLRLLAKGDRILCSGLCQGIGVLDERFIPGLQRLCRRPVTAFPDVTQVNLPARPTALATEIRRKAGDRTIVGIIGLERRKGILTLLRAAAMARATGVPVYFACAGIFSPGEFSEAEREFVVETARKAASGEIGNLHFDPATGRIPDEGDYNSLFSTFDIAWAAYEGFQGSSGTLSKAAAFEIPCLATAGECVGQRVETYRLGLTIPEGDAAEALAVIPLLAAGNDREGKPLAPRFAAYREQHSQARLDRMLGDLCAGLGAMDLAGASR